MGSTEVQDPPGSAAPGTELFVHRIDDNAARMPDHTFVRFPAGPDWATAGYRSLTWRQYADGINKIAHWLDERFGPAAAGDGVAYSGPSDLRWPMLFAAAVKTGRKLIVFGRSNGPMDPTLLAELGCKQWVHAPGDPYVLTAAPPHDNNDDDTVAAGRPLVREFPSLAWCLDAHGAAAYPYATTYAAAQWDEVLVTHTGGTTGAPRPIRMNHGFWAAGASSLGLLARRHWPRGLAPGGLVGRSLLVATPFTHQPGMVLLNMFAVFCDSRIVLLPPEGPHGAATLTPDLFAEILRCNRGHVQGLVAYPPTIAELYRCERARAALRALEVVMYLGAALDRGVGDGLCQHTRLLSVMGATDSGGRFSLHPKDRRLWWTFEFIPEHHTRLVRLHGSGVGMGGSDATDLYQMYIDRPAGGGPSPLQCAFWNVAMFGDVEAIDTEELWRPVEDMDGTTRWEFVSRTNDCDWVKLSSMTKFFAKEAEDLICRHPSVKHVVVGGVGRAVPFSLIDVEDSVRNGRSADDLLDDIFQNTITAVNTGASKQIEIPRETMILITKEKPIKLTVKQLISRREMEAAYAQEIEAVYAKWTK